MRRGGLVAALLVVLAVAAALASPLASPAPDGLERVAADHGFAADGRLHPAQEQAPAPDYLLPGIGDERAATAAAGVAGTLGMLLLGAGLARVLRLRAGAAA